MKKSRIYWWTYFNLNRYKNIIRAFRNFLIYKRYHYFTYNKQKCDLNSEDTRKNVTKLLKNFTKMRLYDTMIIYHVYVIDGKYCQMKRFIMEKFI